MILKCELGINKRQPILSITYYIYLQCVDLRGGGGGGGETGLPGKNSRSTGEINYRNS